MVFITVPAESVHALDAHLQARQIRLAISKPDIRLVTHLDIDDDGVRRTLAAFEEFFA
jgi:threonine aldolase